MLYKIVFYHFTYICSIHYKLNWDITITIAPIVLSTIVP